MLSRNSLQHSERCVFVRLRKDHGELVASHAGQHILASDRFAQHLAGTAQDLVASSMSACVVDRLKPVQVCDKNAYGKAPTSRQASHLLFEAMTVVGPRSNDHVRYAGLFEGVKEKAQRLVSAHSTRRSRTRS